MERVTDEQADVWDKVLTDSKARKGNTASEKKTCRLMISPTRRTVFLPNLKREMIEVPESLREVFRKLCREQLPWPLIINGPAGVGKTCAALCLVDYVPSGEFLTEAQLYEHLNARREDGGLQDLWRQITKAGLFVLDEFGSKTNPSAFQFESMLRFLEKRTALPTILTTNINSRDAGDLLGDISQTYDDRIASRLSAGTVFFLKGEDLRLKRSR